MNDEAHEQVDRDNAINLVEIGHILWKNKSFLIIATIVSAVGALIYCFAATEWFRADVLLKLAETKQSQGLLSQLGDLSGLANLAGLDVNDNKSAEPIAVLKSREFIGAFIEDQNLLPLFFPRKWDASAKHWKSSDPKKQPDVRDGIKYFDERLFSVTEDRKTGLVTLAVRWTDAKIAAIWANMLVERVNDLMRQRALTVSQGNVDYLKHELTSSNVVMLQESIGRVLEAELQKLLLAKAEKEYAFRILDHAMTPKWRAWPDRPLIMSVTPVLGLILAMFFVVSRHMIRRNRALNTRSPVH
jgi:LPS O-antigen subunit length determinant protein (WzzB/FepE family)